MQIHACLLALRTGRPVKMSYGREESFLGHVHRHPARLTLRARRHRGTAAWSTCARAYCSTAARTRRPRRRVLERRVVRVRPLRRAQRRRRAPTPSTRTTRRAARCEASAPCRSASPTSRRWTSWPRALGADPVELRLRNALARRARARRPARRSAGRRRCAELLERLRDRPLPPPAGGPTCRAARAHDARGGRPPRRRLRGRDQEHRAYSEGFDDYATARVRVSAGGGRRGSPRCSRAACEVGQGVDRHPGADRPHRARRRATCACCPPTRTSARRARRRPRARRT